MSTWVLNDVHLDAVLTGAMSEPDPSSGPLRWEHAGAVHELTTETLTDTGRMLRAANVRAWHCNYPPDDHSELDLEPYEFKPMEVPVTPVKALRLVDALVYQLASDNAWPAVEAGAFVDAMRHRMISCIPGVDPEDFPVAGPYDARLRAMIERIPGYDTSLWTLRESDRNNPRLADSEVRW